MIIEEAIQSVQSLYSKGIQSKDTRLTRRHIYHALINARSTVLKQQLNKRQKVNDACYQPLSCIELEIAPKHECACIIDGVTTLRSKSELPRIISNLDTLQIQYVSSLLGDIRFERTKFENVKYASGDKFTGTKSKYYIKNNRIYITVTKVINVLVANVLAEDPIEAAMFASACDDCPDCKCKDVTELDFHTDRDSFNSIAKLAKDELVIMFGQLKQDNIANASEDNGTVGRMIHQPN